MGPSPCTPMVGVQGEGPIRTYLFGCHFWHPILAFLFRFFYPFVYPFAPHVCVRCIEEGCSLNQVELSFAGVCGENVVLTTKTKLLSTPFRCMPPIYTILHVQTEGGICVYLAGPWPTNMVRSRYDVEWDGEKR